MTTDLTFRFDDPHEADRLLYHFEHGDYNGKVVSEIGDYTKPKEVGDAATFYLTEDISETVAELYLALYVRKDGTRGYQVKERGDAHMTTYLGLLEAAKVNVMDHEVWKRA